MNWKKNKPLVFSLGLLFLSVFSLLVAVWQQTNSNKKNKPYFGGEINNFCINDICLAKIDQWTVSQGQKSAPANQEVTKAYALKFQSLVLGEIVSTNKNRFKDLGFGEEQVFLKIKDKSLELGKTNSNYDGTLLKLEKEETVYNSEIVLEKNKLNSFEFWINKSVTNLATLQINKINISSESTNKVVIMSEVKGEDQKWVDKVAHLMSISYLNNFDAQNSQEFRYVIDSQYDSLTLTIGKKSIDKVETYWATTDKSNFYEISKDDFALLTGKIN